MSGKHTLEFIYVYCILVYIIITQISLTSSERSSYGEFCNSTRKCDKSAWLSCQKGACRCIKPDVMLYDTNLGKCVAKSGERCKYMVAGIDEQTPQSVFELIDCVKNASCSPEGFCTCDSKFYENPLNGTCIKGQSINQTCDSLLQCSRYEGLLCDPEEKKCQCNEKESPLLYFPKDGVSRCVGWPGDSCVNSTCREHSTCVESKCKCDPGFWLNNEKKCVRRREMFENCTRDEQCGIFQGSQLVCVEGRCSCDPKVSRYEARKNIYTYGDLGIAREITPSKSSMKCLGLAGSSCIQGLCISNAVCQQLSQNGGNYQMNLGLGGDLGGGLNYNSAQTTLKTPELNKDKCYCTGGYGQSKSGNCVVGFLQQCTSGYDCLDGFVCKKNKCQCPYPNQHFNPLKNTCESKIDGPCNSTNPCISNAECILFSSTPFEAGHCKCNAPGFVKNPEGTCDIAFDQPCNPAIHCDRNAGLVCTNQKCQCDEFAQYSPKERKCFKRIGAPCNLTLAVDDFQECVEHSCCARSYSSDGYKGTCKCLPGFVETPMYTCKLNNDIVLAKIL